MYNFIFFKVTPFTEESCSPQAIPQTERDKNLKLSVLADTCKHLYKIKGLRF